MGLNRKRRIRQARRWAFAHELQELPKLDKEGNVVIDEKTKLPEGSGTFIKIPVTADLSWIKQHLQYPANARRNKEKGFTYRGKVYGAPLRILHNRAKYLEYLNPKAA